MTEAAGSYEIKNLNTLKEWVAEFCATLSAPRLVLLSGEMGVGKTQLVKFLLENLGYDGACSPSFAIHNSYPAKPVVEHIDLYRLESEDDLESVGFWDLFELLDRIIIIEWADRLESSFLPVNWPTTSIKITQASDSVRYLTVK